MLTSEYKCVTMTLNALCCIKNILRREKMKALSMYKLITCTMLFVCILLVTACSGVTIKPDGDGGITVTPNENHNGGNGGNSGNTDSGNDDGNTYPEVHFHTYKLSVSENSSSSCTEDGIRVWRCDCGAEFTENFAALGHDIRSYEGKEPTCNEDGYSLMKNASEAIATTLRMNQFRLPDINLMN